MHFQPLEKYRFIKIEYRNKNELSVNSVQYRFIEPIVSLGIIELECVQNDKVAYVGELEKKHDAFIFEDAHGDTWFNQYPSFFQPTNGHLYPVSVHNSFLARNLKGVKNIPFGETSWMTELSAYMTYLDDYIGKCNQQSVVANIQRLKGDIDRLS